MGKAKYVFRLDDITYDLNLDKFNRFTALLKQYDIKPLLGVIPDNQDPQLIEPGNKSRLSEDDFWQTILELNREHGWAVALHGYNHVYISDNAGILKTLPRSEFAGLGVEEQNYKINQGKKKLEQKGLRIATFMAPSHTFDNITLKVLAQNGIKVVTDGYGVYTYQYRGLTFVPQLFARPRRMPFGVYTFCFHLNEMTEQDFARVDRFIATNRQDIISFEDAVGIKAKGFWRNLLNLLVRLAMYVRALLKLMTKRRD